MTKEKELKEFNKGIKFSDLYDIETCKRIRKEFYGNFKSRFDKLSKKEKTLFMQIRSKSGVLYLQGKPGIAKSAKMRSIAMKMGMLYIDFRLSMVDETDIGMYPKVVTRQIDGKEVDFLDHVAPLWAAESNRVPTLIHFEEINRTSQHVRNASMQVLLERAIGIHVKFNSTVYMVCSGNLGDEDNTDVEELDRALNGRLIHKKYDLTINEWITDFANDNVHPIIVKYLSVFPDQYYPMVTNSDENAYACPRTWTFLSDFFDENFSKFDKTYEDYEDGVEELEEVTRVSWGSIEDFIKVSELVAHEYIGVTAATKFNRYLGDQMNVKMKDILRNYESVRNEVINADQSRWAEWFHTLKSIEFQNITPREMDNLILFLKDAKGEELVGYMTYVLDMNHDVGHPNFTKLVVAFKSIYQEVSSSNMFMQNNGVKPKKLS